MRTEKDELERDDENLGLVVLHKVSDVGRSSGPAHVAGVLEEPMVGSHEDDGYEVDEGGPLGEDDDLVVGVRTEQRERDARGEALSEGSERERR